METIEKVKQMIADGVLKQEDAEKYLPELAESEDVKIRKEMIEILEKEAHDFPSSVIAEKAKTWIAWLELQGEHAKFRDSIQVGDKVTRNQDGVLVNLSQLKRVAKPTDKVEPKFKAGDRVIGTVSGMQYYITEVCDDYYYTESGCAIMFYAQDNFELYKQKPVWSEEDKVMLDKVIERLHKHLAGDKEYLDIYYWLIALKDRVQPQPKQEWSQNDIDMIDWLIRCCEKEHEELCNDKYGHQDIVSDLKRDCRKKWNWLESLKNKVVPQNKWKPSDEQMKILNEVLNFAANHESPHWNDYIFGTLNNLIRQLKTIKG